ncbi:MAG: hypothetical protein J2P28_12880 [Actinobacteria bacterium]|nr:hypothetical protein [Actinomycetota bacterium]
MAQDQDIKQMRNNHHTGSKAREALAAIKDDRTVLSWRAQSKAGSFSLLLAKK